jgi:hypothetical protein
VDASGAATRRWAKALGELGKEACLFARTLGDRQDRSTDLFVVGIPQFEPWHFCAHLDEQAAWSGRADLVPTLLRWSITPGAPSHVAVSVDTLASASRNQTVLVIHPFGDALPQLCRVADARRHGARVMTLHRGHPDLIHLSHETLSSEARSEEGHMTARRPSNALRRAFGVTDWATPVARWVGVRRSHRPFITLPTQVVR